MVPAPIAGRRLSAASATERQRACRARRRAGLTLLTIEIDENALAAALIASDRLSEAAALEPGRVEQAVAELLHDWSERWRVTV